MNMLDLIVGDVVNARESLYDIRRIPRLFLPPQTHAKEEPKDHRNHHVESVANGRSDGPHTMR